MFLSVMFNAVIKEIMELNNQLFDIALS